MDEGGPIAQAAVELVADVSKLGDDVRVKVTAAAAAAGKDFDREIVKQTRDTGKKVSEQVKRDTAKGGKEAGTGWGQAFRNAIAFTVTHKTIAAVLAPLSAIGKTLVFSTIAAGAAAAVLPVLQLAAALGSAAGSAAGLAFALPSALAVGGAALATFKVALTGMGDAFSAALEGDPEKFAKSIEKLAPAAQAVAREMFVLGPALFETRNAVQGAFFGPLQGQLTSLSATLLGPVREGMVAVATEGGQLAVGLADVARQSESVDLVNQAFATAAGSVDSLQPGLLSVVTGFRDLGIVALPIIARLSGSAGGLLERFGAWLTRMAEGGYAVAWIEDALLVLRQLGALVADIGGIIQAVFRAAAASGGDVLGVIGQVLDQVHAFLDSAEGQSALISLFQGLGVIGEALRPVLQGLIGLLGHIAPVVGEIAVALSGGLVAAIAVLYQVVDGLGPALVAIAAALSETFANETLLARLGELAASIGQLLIALAPLLPTLGQIVAFLAGALIGALQVITPLVGVLVSVFGALWPVLEPILVAVAAMAGVLVLVIGPLLAWIQAWMALTRVLAIVRTAWMILNIVFAASPIGFIITLVVGLVAAFIYLWNTSDAFRGFFIAIWDAIKGAAGAVISWLGGALSGLGSWFASLPGTIGSALSSLGSAIGSALSAIGSWFAGLPGMILAGLAALPGLLLDLFLGAIGLVLEAIGAGIGLILVAIFVLPGLIIDGLAALGGMIAALFTWAWDMAVAVFYAYIGLLVFVVTELPGKILSALASLGGMIGGAFTAAWNWAVNASVSAGQAILGFVVALPGRIGGFLASLPGIIGNAFVAAWNWARQAAIDGANAVVGFIASVPGRIAGFAGTMLDAGRRLIGALFDGLSQVGGFAGDVASAIVSGIKSGINWVIDRLNAGIRSVWPSFAGSAPQIPRLAHGGIITHRIVAELGEAGPEVVIPLTRPRRAVQLAQESGLIRLLADQQVLTRRGDDGLVRTGGREVHVHAPITVNTAAANPLIVARRAADHLAVLAQL